MTLSSPNRCGATTVWSNNLKERALSQVAVKERFIVKYDFTAFLLINGSGNYHLAPEIGFHLYLHQEGQALLQQKNLRHHYRQLQLFLNLEVGS